MDLELLCLTSTLNKRQARRFPADSHQRTGPCDLTIHVKESLIVFGNMFYSSDGVGGGVRTLLTSVSDLLAKQVCRTALWRMRGRLHNCSFRLGSDRFGSEALTSAALCTNACRHHGQFWRVCTERCIFENTSLQTLSFSLLHRCGSEFHERLQNAQGSIMWCIQSDTPSIL